MKMFYIKEMNRKANFSLALYDQFNFQKILLQLNVIKSYFRPFSLTSTNMHV